MGDGRVLEFGSFRLELGPNIRFIAMFEGSFLDWDDVVFMLFRQDLSVMDRLDSGVVMVLMNLPLDGSGNILMMMRLGMLFGDGGGDRLVNGGSVTRLANEVLYGLLCFVHDEDGDCDRDLAELEMVLEDWGDVSIWLLEKYERKNRLNESARDMGSYKKKMKIKKQHWYHHEPLDPLLWMTIVILVRCHSLIKSV